MKVLIICKINMPLAIVKKVMIRIHIENFKTMIHKQGPTLNPRKSLHSKILLQRRLREKG